MMVTDVENEKLQREWMFEYLTRQNPESWYWHARDWNWGNGLWLLEWIIKQEACNGATAQIIFWLGDPEQFLPLTGVDDSITLMRMGIFTQRDLPLRGPEDWKMTIENSKETFDLLSLILRNWTNGKYRGGKVSTLGQLKRLLLNLNIKAFAGTFNRLSKRDTIGWHDPENSISHLASYRNEEKKCDPNFLPWEVPDEMGHPTSDKLSNPNFLDLTEGFPPEYFLFLKNLEQQSKT
jgi:Domain of unknown function (DUF4274)